MEFKIGDKAVHPAHGVGIIKNIESQDIGGKELKFYVLQTSNGATLKVPTTRIRGLMSKRQIIDVYAILKSQGHITQTTWNRRFREFKDKLGTGSISDIAEVLRDLNSLKCSKGLSFVEKRMMEQARAMIVAEISAASERDEEDIEVELDEMLLH